MKKIKLFLQFLEWIVRFGLLTPDQRRQIKKRHTARPRSPYSGDSPPAGSQEPPGPVQIHAHWLGELVPGSVQPVGAASALPPLAPDLMLTVTGCVMLVTGCTLWFASQGWMEALYNIPFFIISVLVALLHRGISCRG